MFRIAIYALITLAAVILAAVLIFRSKSYHQYVVRQLNMWDEEYDRIYSMAD